MSDFGITIPLLYPLTVLKCIGQRVHVPRDTLCLPPDIPFSRVGTRIAATNPQHSPSDTAPVYN